MKDYEYQNAGRVDGIVFYTTKKCQKKKKISWGTWTFAFLKDSCYIEFSLDSFSGANSSNILVVAVIWDKQFKNGPSKIWGIQSSKNLKWYGLF